ncbi:MAG: hypothetical protein AAB453_04070 [Patescibacteria group bacterium]
MIKNGFVLLYAVLLVSIVLTVSLSLFDISYRQIVLSSTVESAQLSFYIADWVRDCIKSYNNFNPIDSTSIYNYFGKFDTSNPANIYAPNQQHLPNPPFSSISSLDCNAVTNPTTVPYTTTETSTQVVSKYTFGFGPNSTVDVVINKAIDTGNGNKRTEEFTVTGTYGVGSRQVQTSLLSRF